MKKGRCLKRARNGRCVKRAKHRRKGYRKARASASTKRRTKRRGYRKARRPAGMARKGSHCRRMGSVYSRKLRKRVKRCVGGYSRR